MQILIGLCSNILKTMTVAIFGDPWWFDHIMVEARVHDACAQTCGKMRVCLHVGVLTGCIPVLQNISGSFVLNSL